jgi:hypothetical protein
LRAQVEVEVIQYGLRRNLQRGLIDELGVGTDLSGTQGRTSTVTEAVIEVMVSDSPSAVGRHGALLVIEETGRDATVVLRICNTNIDVVFKY